jgi:hypothetical protein
MPDGPDIWTRLARLDQCCTVGIQSVYITEASGQTRREWEVKIALKAGPADQTPVRVLHVSLFQAVLIALDDAAARRWPDDLPKG